MKIQKIVTKDIVFVQTSRYANQADAITHGKMINNQRRKELGLDITPIRNRAVIQFHWNFDQLILEFESNLFLRTCLSGDKINVALRGFVDIKTDENLAFDLLLSGNYCYIWNPSKIAKDYTGKIFKDISKRLFGD